MGEYDVKTLKAKDARSVFIQHLLKDIYRIRL